MANMKKLTSRILQLVVVGAFALVLGLSACKSKSSGSADRIDATKTSKATKSVSGNDAADAEESIPVAADFEDQVAEEISPENADETLAAIEAEIDAL